MPASIGVNLRVTGHCSQGGRKYMEDFFAVAYQQTENDQDLEYAFFGIYDGHGGGEAATYAKDHLMGSIVRQRKFWSDKDEDVLRAIKEGYLATHYAMWKEQVNWPKTTSGLPSTAGTTATIAFIRRAKLYIGHVGDSGVVLGYQEPGCSEWLARPLTRDHKPENAVEMTRIKRCGGKVVVKLGVPRVVWNRPRIGHQGPVRRSTPIDEIPFLAVARSLGDLWSYNSALDEFIVSPDPDTCVIPIDTNTFRCLIFGTDGLWNMVTPQVAVQIVQATEIHNEKCATANPQQKVWINPSKSLVEKSLERWSTTKMRADNTTAVTLLLNPPGPPRAKVVGNRRKQFFENVQVPTSPEPTSTPAPPPPEYPTNGLAIMTRYSIDTYTENPDIGCSRPMTPTTNVAGASRYHDEAIPTTVSCSSDPFYSPPASPLNCTREDRKLDCIQENIEPVCTKGLKNPHYKNVEQEPQVPTESTETSKPSISDTTKIAEQIENIQINEVSSSSPNLDDKTESGTQVKLKKKKSCRSKQRSRSCESKILEGYYTTRSPVGLCTRSHDLQKMERRTRPVLSSSDVSSTKNDGPKRMTGVVKRHNINETRNFNKNKAELTDKIQTRGRKRNVLDHKIETKTAVNDVDCTKVDERLFPPEPVSKKIRSLSRYENTISNIDDRNLPKSGLFKTKRNPNIAGGKLNSRQIRESISRVSISKTLNVKGMPKCLTRRNRLPGKFPMQTRNRVKRFSK